MVLRGELDLEDAAIARVQSAVPTIRLDLRELTFIDSSGARAVWSAHLRAREAAGSLAVAVAPRAVRRALAVTGLDKELTLIEDLEHGPSEGGSPAGS